MFFVLASSANGKALQASDIKVTHQTNALIASNSTTHKPIVIATKGDWPPYLFVDGNGTFQGSDYSLLKSTLDDLKIPLSVVPYIPPKRKYLMFQQGDVSMYIATTKNRERMKYGYFSIPYRQEQAIAFCYQSNCQNYQTLADYLAAFPSALVEYNATGWHGETFKMLVENKPAQFRHSDNLERRLKMLISGHVDIIFGDASAIELYAQKYKIKLKKIKLPVNQTEVHFYFSKNSVDKAFIKRFNQALAKQLAKP
ncbi:substrate-binding periplasmic protein [Thalassotalea euphylliae]|uniref:substrate-binding periplasmic protein n=1 Tax=Thalassotalea euphylliae TaxID=1655234 RepID=UPI0015F275EC|nr:transporter substrate-binding domain-containing protein [Thalassotalea euphylliae]